jgi:hypothetical protein
VAADDPKPLSPAGAPAPEDAPEDERDFVFQARMAIWNTFLGYWKQSLAVVAVGLLGAGAYGAWQNQQLEAVRGVHASIARIERKVPEPQQGFPYLPADDPADAARLSTVAEQAAAMEALGRAEKGPAAAYALLRAASLFERANQPDGALRCAEAAHGLGLGGALGWGATAALAARKAATGDTDGALALYTAASAAPAAGTSAEQALFLRGRLLRAVGRTAEAVTVFEEFNTRFPKSGLGAQVGAELREAKSAG